MISTDYDDGCWFRQVDVVAFRAVVRAASISYWMTNGGFNVTSVNDEWKDVNRWLDDHMPSVRGHDLWYAFLFPPRWCQGIVVPVV